VLEELVLRATHGKMSEGADSVGTLHFAHYCAEGIPAQSLWGLRRLKSFENNGAFLQSIFRTRTRTTSEEV
jgi:hypothetical protein